MDFAIKPNGHGRPLMSWDKAEDISTNIWYSLNTEINTFFQNPEFGVTLSDIKKVTDNNIELVKQRIETALAWLVDIERLDNLSVIVEKDNRNYNQVNYKIDAKSADGYPLSVTGFVTVGGASDDFVF